MLNYDLFGNAATDDKHGSTLAENWDYPPFSVLNARDGWWQERKRQWLALGIQSELGRDAGMLFDGPQLTEPGLEYYRNRDGAGKYGRCFGQDIEHVVGGVPKAITTTGWMREKDLRGGCSGGNPAINGTSIFDPVLTELCYRWFMPAGGRVIDPFAGGSVRGIVASVLGYRYEGCELRAAQVAANKGQAGLALGRAPVWVCDDSKNIGAHFAGGADFVFSCPPYANLERYSDDKRDISNMDYAEFGGAYSEIIKTSCGLLADDRFACFVVGEVRGADGAYLNFVGDTVNAFLNAGLKYYNESIMVTAAGSLPIRANNQFKASRKIGKTHQNVLVFVKGDGKRAARYIESKKESPLGQGARGSVT